MAIQSTDIKYRLSGGASNSNAAASIGGIKSSVDAVNYFADVSSEEAVAGKVVYRCIFLHNNHSSLSMLGAKLWILANTPGANTSVSIGLGSSAINGVEQTIANETTAPSGVTFSQPTSLASGLDIGDIPHGQHKAIWVRLTVSAGATLYADSFSLRSQCDTNP